MNTFSRCVAQSTNVDPSLRALRERLDEMHANETRPRITWWARESYEAWPTISAALKAMEDQPTGCVYNDHRNLSPLMPQDQTDATPAKPDANTGRSVSGADHMASGPASDPHAPDLVAEINDFVERYPPSSLPTRAQKASKLLQRAREEIVRMNKELARPLNWQAADAAELRSELAAQRQVIKAARAWAEPVQEPDDSYWSPATVRLVKAVRALDAAQGKT